jgi:glycosyltransferase involved in cell wall biosynthesis
MEGFPSAPCEAMLCECIPITSNVGALPLIVGDAGFILDRKDPEKLKELFKQALASNVDDLGKKARRRIIAKFPVGERNKLVDILYAEMEN